ncbi:MAG TPA: hypothetical protein VE422_30430 [Terriglobia bacterium]|nr:hypothetical protein [Terriglobia bacterium]
MNAVVDNDILFKGACFGMLQELIFPVCAGDAPGVLGAARFVVAKTIEKKRIRGNVADAVGRLKAFLSQAKVLEPTDAELTMAADFELAAQRLGSSFDTGESVLSAVTIIRLVPLLLTGDKRAIRTMEKLLESDARIEALCGKVRCLEQLVLSFLTDANSQSVKGAICSEPDADKTLTICFSCASGTGTYKEFSEGLESYIRDLRSSANRILAG